MTPYARTLEDWHNRPRQHPLSYYEEIHKRLGFLFSTPAYYVMGRPVMKFAPIDHILDVEHVFDFAQCDTWYIFQLTGETQQAWRILPWELPWMCWKRENDPDEELRFYETRRLMRLSGVAQ